MKKIYSEYLEEMIAKGFTLNGKHYTWNETDLVYYRDDVDDRYLEEMPKEATPD